MANIHVLFRFPNKWFILFYINSLVITIFTPMDKQKQQEQIQQLKDLAKKSPENVRKVVQEKIKGLQKPFNK